MAIDGPIWRDWSVSAQGGTTTVTIRHRWANGGPVVLTTQIALNAGTTRIGNDVSDLMPLDGGVLGMAWTDNKAWELREYLRNQATPGYGQAQVRNACEAVFGMAENVQIRIQ